MSQRVLEDDVIRGVVGSKRGADVLLAIVALVLLAPLMVLVALTIWVVNGRGPLVKESSIGRGGVEFSMLKFRSSLQDERKVPSARGGLDDMMHCTEAKVEPARDRFTPLGYLLHESGVDGLPRLLNIVRGDMSFVGPKPLTPREAAEYGDEFDICFAVRPGLTGLWQTSALTDDSLEDRVRHDKRYAETQSLRSDLLILFKTVPIVLAGRGNF